MKNSLSLILVLIGLFTLSTAFAKPGGGPGKMGHFNLPDELRPLFSEADSLMLINHLNLSDDQRSQIKALLEPIQEEHATLKKQQDAWHRGPLKDRIETVVKDLKGGRTLGEPDAALAESFSELQTLRMGMRIKAKAIMDEIRVILSEDQRNAVSTFDPGKAMSLPRGPMGKGRLQDLEPGQFVETIRTMSDDEFAFMIQRFEQRATDKPGMRKRGRGKRGKGMGSRGAARAERMTALVTLMKNVRAMSDSDYQDKKSSIQSDMTSLRPANRGKRGQGMRQGRGQGMGQDRGQGMGQGRGQGMGQGRGQGMKRRGNRGHGKSQKLLHRIIFSEEFYNAL